MNHLDLKFLRSLFASLTFSVLIFAGCSSGETCSSDSQCKDGRYCDENKKCIEFQADDYSIVFENLKDGQGLSSADDNDVSKEGVQIEVALNLDTLTLHDNMDVALSITGVGTEYKGVFIKNRAVFSGVTIPFGSIQINAFLVQNPDVKTTLNLNVKQIDIVPSYLKSGKNGTSTLLDRAVVVDDDDYDSASINGIQLYLTAQTEGIAEGETVVILAPEIQDEALAEGTVDAEGKVDFNEVTIPIVKTIRMSFINGSFRKSIEFTLDTKEHCGFLVNLQDNAVYGMNDDEDESTKGLQYEIVISEIAGCAEDSAVEVYVDALPGDGITPHAAFIADSDLPSHNITLNESESLEDTRSVFIKMIDDKNDLYGTAGYDGIIVDIKPPAVEITNPQVGAILNMEDDKEPATAGLQINFEGTSADTLTKPVSLTVKLGETVLETIEGVDGQYTVPYSFAQSYETLVLYVEATDGAGNMAKVFTPFSVNIDTDITFQSICGKTGADIIPGMYLNAQDDENTSADLLQCTVILKLAEGALGNAISLKVGDNDAEKRAIGGDNTTVFNIELPESKTGIHLLAKAYQDDEVKDEISQIVMVDTVAPEATLGNNLLLNSGDTTSSVDLTFTYSCSESCSYNGLFDSETGDIFSSDTERALTGLSGGPHSFTLRARDYAGNISDPVNFNWTVDSEAPETTIDSDPGTGTSNDWVLFTFSSSETGSTFECKLEKEGGNYIPSDDSWESCNGGKRDYYNLDDGNYRFLVRASDSLGNQDPSPAEHEFIVGSVAPDTTIDTVTPSADFINVSVIEFGYSATVASTFKCKLIKGSTVVEDWVDCSSGTKNYSSLDAGGYIFYVRATSLTMIQEKTPEAYGFNVDLSDPVIIFDETPPAQSPYDSGSIEFHCESAEDNCTYECLMDTVSVNCSSGSYTYSSLSEGAHTFLVKATDRAGNYVEESVNWNVDSGVLGVTITSNPDKYSNNDSATFEFTATQVSTYECSLDSGAYEICSSGKSYNSLSEGTHTFIVRATSGSDTAEDSYSWTVDTVDPVITIDVGPNNPTYETGAQFSFSASEDVTFECKLSSESVWVSCVSPKVYPSGTFGIPDTNQNYTFELRAADKAGNTGSSSYGWTVDGTQVKIEWISPAPNSEGKILVGKSDDVYGTDEARYAINIKVKISGSNPGQPVNVAGFKTPPGYTVVNVDTTGEKTYTLVVGLQDGARVNNPLTVSVADDSGDEAQVSKVVIVNTEEPTISWAYPVNGTKFLSGGDSPKVIFNLWNAEVGTTIELVDADTESVVGTGVTVGSSGGLQEYVTINLELDDRCSPYNFYATFQDTTGERYYTNATNDVFLKSIRSMTIDKTKPVIDSVSVLNVDDIDRILNRADNQNIDPEGGMQIDISVEISDPENSDDSSRIVKVFTDNGTGTGAAILLNTLTGISNQADFEDVSLGEFIHSLRIEALDCSGNSTSSTLAPITVDTVVPELTLTSPRGSSSNWHWITTADDPTLGTIDGDGDFTGVSMHINSSEELGSYVEVLHTVYNYSDVEIYNSDISADVTLNTSSLDIALPDLIYAKHEFKVTVEDMVGNRAVIGDNPENIYEVDAVVPELTFTNISGGETFSTDSDAGMPGFQIPISMQFSDVAPESEYEITANPVLSEGGGVDSSRFPKKWIGSVTSDSLLTRNVTIGKGWWRISAVITDDHENSSITPETGNIDIEVDADIAIIALRKSFGYADGTGPVLYGYSVENASFFVPTDLTCAGSNCETELEVWTDAPVGSEAYISIDGGPEIRVDTVNGGSFSVSYFEGTSKITLDSTQEYSILDVRLKSTSGSEAFEKYYVKLDTSVPQLVLISPEDCSGDDVCRRLDIADDPLTTDVIELAEIGYGFADDAVTGGLLNFKPSNAVRFQVLGAEDGKIEIESVAGIENGSAVIQYDSGNSIYYADFENMTVADTNTLGQKDYELIFTVTEEPSGALAKYSVKLHLELLQPPAINIAGNVDYSAKEAKVSVDWVAIQGNNSTFGGVPGAMHEYEVKYQDYGEGVCTLAVNFEAAKTPLETIAGSVPTPVVGNMNYDFYLNKINNGRTETDPQFKEADIHQNGNPYCFGVRAVDAVYATDGTVLVKNPGIVIQEDVGNVEMSWSEVRGPSPLSHRILLTNVGDIDRDGKDDFAVSDMYRSSNGTDDDTAGNVQIFFSGGEKSFNKNGSSGDFLGIGISTDSDFNGDGFRDFAYTDLAGEVFIHHGGVDGLNETADTVFNSKDNSDDALRSMASGDYNGDGCDDIVISSPNENGSGNARGEVYIYYGRGGAGCPALPYDGNNPDVIFEGENDNDKLGFLEMRAIGDTNDDGKIDFAVSNLFKLFVIYGGNETGGVISDVYSGLNILPGERTGYGNFNGDSYSDMVVGDKSRILIFYGGETGLSEAPDVTINDMDVMSYTYNPDFSNFANAVSHYNPDINGDGRSDLGAASSDGMFVYYTINGYVYTTPSVYDSFVNASSTRLLMLDYGVVYCNYTQDFGSCYIMNYGE